MVEEPDHGRVHQSLLALAVVGALVLVGAVLFVVLRLMTSARDPVVQAAEAAVNQPGPVRDDLIKRGLYIPPQADVETGSLSPAVLKIADIDS
jgi:hypothetical protein